MYADDASRQENYVAASINQSVDQARDVGQIVKDSGVAKPQRYPQGYRSLLWTYWHSSRARALSIVVLVDWRYQSKFVLSSQDVVRLADLSVVSSVELCFMAMRG